MAALGDKNIEIIGREADEAFLASVRKQCVLPEGVAKAGLKIVYTPFNGA